jgi:radical SAM modification target selenobiotic family peptide
MDRQELKQLLAAIGVAGLITGAGLATSSCSTSG